MEYFSLKKKYAFHLLQKVRMGDCKLVHSRLSTSEKFSMDEGSPLGQNDSTWYISIVGALQYLTLKRLDTSFAINKVCQFLHDPIKAHWAVVKRILRYLKNSTCIGLKIMKSKSFQVSTFSDAD
jgi:hypothetical protein